MLSGRGKAADFLALRLAARSWSDAQLLGRSLRSGQLQLQCGWGRYRIVHTLRSLPSLKEESLDTTQVQARHPLSDLDATIQDSLTTVSCPQVADSVFR